MNDSNVISSVGRGTVWKWSNSQIDSKPSRSACCATSVVRRHASSGSQPSYSPIQPWGTITPIFIASSPSMLAVVDNIVMCRRQGWQSAGGASNVCAYPRRVGRGNDVDPGRLHRVHRGVDRPDRGALERGVESGIRGAIGVGVRRAIDVGVGAAAQELAVDGKEFAYELPATIPSGPTRVTLNNVGQEEHQRRSRS